jgi:hypothetical protein
MKKTLLIFICFTILIFPFFSEDTESYIDFNLKADSQRLNEYYNNPFEAQLDEYKKQYDKGRNRMTWGLILSAVFIVNGTVFQTMDSLGIVNETLADIMIYSSYGAVPVCSAWSIAGLSKWNKNSENYLQTLKLETQYYNLITQ